MKAMDSVLVSVATLATLVTTAAMVMVFFYAPVEMKDGIVQKIFYAHVPSAMAMYAGFAITSLASVFYLARPNKAWDAAAIAGVEMGLFFGAYVIISGPLWAMKSWGKLWEFDPQLTATLILFLMYSAYAMLRMFGGPSGKIKKIAAVFAILSAVGIPLVHWSIKIWGGIHPTVEREGGEGLGAGIASTFGTSMLGFLLLFTAMFWLQWSIRKEQETVEELYVEIADLMKSRE